MRFATAQADRGAPVIPHVFPKIWRREASQRGSPCARHCWLSSVRRAVRVSSAMLAELKPIFPLPIPVLGCASPGAGWGRLSRDISVVPWSPGRRGGRDARGPRSGEHLRRSGRHHAELRALIRFVSSKTSWRHVLRRRSIISLQSVVGCYGHRAAAAFFSGMGEDGAEGMLAVRRRTDVRWAGDEATSLFYGMPLKSREDRGARSARPPVGGFGHALAWLKVGTALRAP